MPMPVIVNLRIADSVRSKRPPAAAEHIGSAGDGAVAADDRLWEAVDRAVLRARLAVGVDLVHDHALGARDDMAPGKVGEQSKTAGFGVPGVADQSGEFGRPLFRAAPIIDL